MKGLKFRILLDSAENQEVFRDILINSDDSFEVFYHAILKSFEFTGKEMASFYVSNDDWDKGHEISWMDMSYDENDRPEDLPSVMSKAHIKDFIAEPDQKFILVYDFLRMWIFLIELIGYSDEIPTAPTVLLAMGASPDEDSKPISEQALGGDFEDDDDDDDFGFEGLDDGYDDEDYSNYDDFEI
jgi:Plasmid pRiA4b ORF-3-like protein